MHGAAPLFSEDFSTVKAGAVPEALLVLGGNFTVRSDGKERFLELPGRPLALHGVMFGPRVKEGVAVEARVLGKRRGRRTFPAFGVGLNGVSGYRLMVSPAKGKLELFKGEALVRAVPFDWKPGQWSHLRLEILASKGGWMLMALVWAEGEKTPKKPSLIWHDKQEPLAGRATAWGAPYAGTPIRFDDLRVRRLD